MRKSISESLADLKTICEFNRERGFPKKIKIAISMVFGSPFTKSLPEDSSLFKIMDFSLENGINDITLSDTWGNADEKIFSHQLKKILKKYPDVDFSLHLHDIGGKGLVNLKIGLEEGIKKFDAAIGGIGGCPFSTEKGGNIDLLESLSIVESMGLEHGVDLFKLKEAEKFFRSMRKLKI